MAWILRKTLSTDEHFTSVNQKKKVQTRAIQLMYIFQKKVTIVTTDWSKSTGTIDLTIANTL